MLLSLQMSQQPQQALNICTVTCKIIQTTCTPMPQKQLAILP